MGIKAFRIETSPLDGYSHMALDEALLDAAEDGVHYLRIYSWAGASPFGVTFGYSQSYEEIAEEVRKRYGGITFPVVRRCTGGGLVYHDGDITFSFVFPWPRLITPSLIYKNIHLGLHLGLKSRGLASRLWSPAKPSPPSLKCFSRPEPKDLVHENGVKFLGGALRRRRGFGLYQGSLRAEGFSVESSVLSAAVDEGFGLQWSALFRPVPPPPAAAAEAGRLRREKYSRDKWNKKR